jgi:hypothetical protein
MTDVSKQRLMRGGIVAAAGILIGTICQASLTDPSQCRPASNAGLSVVSGGYGDATRGSLSNRDPDGVRRACGSSDGRPQRARVVEPEFFHGVQIASGARSASN